jgi:hypothetical protein
VRVHVKIPGGVEVYFIDLKGNKHTIDNYDQMWKETHCSAVLRAIMDEQLGSTPIRELVKMDPLPTVISERKFLEIAAGEFSKGWQLGSDSLVQSPTLTMNHLVTGILKYFKDSNRTADAVRFFEPLFEKNHEMGSILGQVYIAGGNANLM